MNKSKKKIIFSALAVMVAMLLFPPFEAVATKSGVVSNMGYAWLFDPPRTRVSGSTVYASVNAGMLLLQWFVVVIVAGVWIGFLDEGVAGLHERDGRDSAMDAVWRDRMAAVRAEMETSGEEVGQGMEGITVTGSMPDLTGKIPVRMYEQGDWLLMLYEDLLPLVARGDAKHALMSYELAMVAFNKPAKVPVMMVTLEKGIGGQLFYCKFRKNGQHVNVGSGESARDHDVFTVRSTADICDSIGADRSMFKRIK